MQRLFRENLEAANLRGTDEQKWRMADAIEITSRYGGELSDFMGGRKKPEKNGHHPPKELTLNIIDHIGIILRIRREIEG